MRRTDVVLKLLGHLDAIGELTGADLIGCTAYGDSTVYVALRRLTEAEFVTRRNETAEEARADPNYNGNRPRVFYKITDAGTTFLRG
jgi:DNA-binding PadR family transcriptional regulator